MVFSATKVLSLPGTVPILLLLSDPIIRSMRPIQMVDTKTQYQKIKSEVDKAIINVVKRMVVIVIIALELEP